MRAPRLDAPEMLFVEIARPPDDVRSMSGEMDHVLAGAAGCPDHVAGFARKKWLQHRPDRLMVAMKRRRIETAVGFDRPAILAELHDKLSHRILRTVVA